MRVNWMISIQEINSSSNETSQQRLWTLIFVLSWKNIFSQCEISEAFPVGKICYEKRLNRWNGIIPGQIKLWDCTSVNGISFHLASLSLRHRLTCESVHQRSNYLIQQINFCINAWKLWFNQKHVIVLRSHPWKRCNNLRKHEERKQNIHRNNIHFITNLTFDNGPKVSWNKESEQEPRNESSRSIFGWLFLRFTSILEFALMNDFDDTVLRGMFIH